MQFIFSRFYLAVPNQNILEHINRHWTQAKSLSPPQRLLVLTFHRGLFGVGRIRWAKWLQAKIEQAVNELPSPFFLFLRACSHFTQRILPTPIAPPWKPRGLCGEERQSPVYEASLIYELFLDSSCIYRNFGQRTMRTIMFLKGKAGGAVIWHVKWASAWISFMAVGHGWYGVLKPKALAMQYQQ